MDASITEKHLGAFCGVQRTRAIRGLMTSQISRSTVGRLIAVAGDSAGGDLGLAWRTALLHLRWRSSASLVVQLTAISDAGDVLFQREVSRDLLRDGLISPFLAGAEGGLVRAGSLGRPPCDFAIALHEERGTIFTYAPRDVFEEVLSVAYRVVREGQELSALDVDMALSAILRDEKPDHW